ncbi:putative outer membrane protein, probably involved in nutrient binding protein [Lunatimonas lonarensis]|uniref:Putative outer membrane protein, probably involved in nutrient binding protein n=1 Tax=Lunatimonas lonarensis TaxID=1232681 RepID=R7ZMC3_9BACT|nr:RagB/SusD family nutrient uptake outer membrane protein [Lunatimonas lonarensis]EON75251.1 putative outer membrane protein, probably involved in nutrient binding protein [Lunatimonas lonarensis]
MKKISILFGVLAVILSGCEDFLTVVPETNLSTATFFQSEADFQQAVNAAYAPMRAIVNDRAWMLSEMRSDNTMYARNIMFGATEQQEDISDHAIPDAQGINANTHVLNHWRLDYQIIARANQILTTIDDVDFNANSKNNIKGQALFLRAMAYYDLARFFGSVPIHLAPVTTREEAGRPLSPEADVYAQLISDVQAAIPLLPNRSQQELGRVTSGAARMLLADVFIRQKRWAEAEALLKEIVNSGQYQLIPDYANVFSESTANKNNVESVFEVQFLEGPQGLQSNFLYQFMPRPINPSELGTITGTANPQNLDGQGNNIPTPDIIEAYEEGDLRKDASIGFITLSGSLRENKVYPYIKKYAKPHALHNNHGMNWPIYRYAETLLFLAEALNEQGKTSEAAQYINMVRNRAGLDDTTAGSQGAMRDAIMHERRVELAFENKRWHDLTRTDTYRQVITDFGVRAKADPVKYYYPAGNTFRNHAFSNITKFYTLPAAESEITPHF